MTQVLVVDVGGSKVKILLTGEQAPRRAPSGPKFTAQQMVEAVQQLGEGWEWDVVSVGIPSPVHGGRVATDPVNLGKGWAGFDYEAAFGKPTKVVNDAAMQALGSYDGGKMLFLRLGTGLRSSPVLGGVVEPMELRQLPLQQAPHGAYLREARLAR